MPWAVLGNSRVCRDADAKSKLIALAAANNGVVKLDDESYNLLASPDRDWSSVIQLTALGGAFKCPPCKELDPIFRTLGKAWSKVNSAERDQHFFATLDFEDGKETFRKLGLASAPMVRVMPPAQGPRSPANGNFDSIVFDFGNTGFDTALLAEQLSRHTPVPIPYRAPPNYALIATSAGSLIASAVVARFILPILLSRWTWAIFSIGTSLVMVGGYMFVRIRGMPYVAGDPNGGVQLISPGFQSQYGIEVQIIAFIYGLLSLSFVVLTLLVPRQTSAARQRYGVYVWTGISLALFSVLLSVFRIKNPGYPFRLLL
ncbi:dolichyl-diphosphooligosaccharide-protein glycotransferase [Hysterangium stoloniferum]|nr:dolichyl-diphosphooligosaccharide-protein glycotransferase [Hysterangium stoloniferum]